MKSKARLRPLHHLMDTDELTPEERLDRIVEILTEGVLAVVAEEDDGAVLTEKKRRVLN